MLVLKVEKNRENDHSHQFRMGIRIFSKGQKKWLEISSVSNFKSYQSNRLNLKFKNKEGKNELLHTLNGSSLALPRVMAGLIENNQTNEGIQIPKALVPYTGFNLIN